MSAAQALALRGGFHPGVVGLPEKPWPGNEGITR